MSSSIVTLLLALIMLPAAHAAGLRKCALADGRHLYVNSDCPAGSRPLWQRAIDTAAADDDELRRRREDTTRWQQMNREEISANLRVRATRGSGRARASTANRCRQARERRDRIRQRDFMRMDYERMLALDRQVTDACR